MFQPQATQYSPFASYGMTAPIGEFPSFPPANLDNGGPTVFRDPPIFASTSSGNFTTNNVNYNLPVQTKMANHGMSNEIEAQEALARDFQPALEVC